MYIYVYMAFDHSHAYMFANNSIFPKFYSKKWPKNVPEFW